MVFVALQLGFDTRVTLYPLSARMSPSLMMWLDQIIFRRRLTVTHPVESGLTSQTQIENAIEFAN
jgi:hypothetical protein